MINVREAITSVRLRWSVIYCDFDVINTIQSLRHLHQDSQYAGNEYSIHGTQSSNTLVNKRRRSSNTCTRSHDFLAAMTNQPHTTTDTRPSRQIHAITNTKETKLSTRPSHIGKKRMMWMTLILGELYVK
jgi:hypothetical protein